MCGIFGVFYTDQAHAQLVKQLDDPEEATSLVPPHEQVLAQLAVKNLPRGNKAFGYFAWREDTRFARRFTMPYNGELITGLRMKQIVVHNRAPTSGSADDVTQVHPYEGKYGYLFMNGILLNYHDFEARRTHRSAVDTAYLLGNIDYHLDQRDSPVARYDILIADAVEEFRGQQACVFIEPKWGDVWFWRCMATLYFGAHPRQGFSVISSSPIPGICEYLLPEGYVWSLDRNRCKIVSTARFKYENIYASQVTDQA